MVHRDVKPANVLLAGEAGALHAYLTDFGLTRLIGSASAMTQTGTFVGTVDYAAPEQLHGIDVDARTDVYSLTCVLYEELTGQVPYPRESNVAKMYAHAQEPPPSLLAAAPGAPGGLEDVIRRGMAKDPAERYRSASELARATVAAVEGREGATAVTAKRRRRRTPLAAAAVTLALAAAAVLALGRGGEKGPPTATPTPAAVTSKDAYQDAMLDAFRPVTTTIVTVEPTLPARVDDPQDQVAAATTLAKVRTAMDKALATIRGLTPPADVRDLHARLLAIFDRMRDHVADSVAAADFGNTRDYRVAGRAFNHDQTLLDPLAPEFRARGYSRLGEAQ
jgi:hypothetical protein